MSTRILDAYLYDKPEEELMKELNSIRDAFHDYLKANIKKDPNKWRRWGQGIVDKGKETGEDSLRRAIRYIKAGLETVEVGNPLDVAANCVVVKHRKKIAHAENIFMREKFIREPHTRRHICLEVLECG